MRLFCSRAAERRGRVPTAIALAAAVLVSGAACGAGPEFDPPAVGASSPVAAAQRVYGPGAASSDALDGLTADIDDDRCPEHRFSGNAFTYIVPKLYGRQRLHYTVTAAPRFWTVYVSVRDPDGESGSEIDPTFVVERKGRFFVC